MFSFILFIIVLINIMNIIQSFSFSMRNRVMIKNNHIYQRNMNLSMQKVKYETITRQLSLTPALEERIESKIGKVLHKLGSDVIHSHVTLRIHKFPDTGKFSIYVLISIFLFECNRNSFTYNKERFTNM